MNSTTYVSPTRLISNINVADAAELAKFDIEVTLSSGRTGKGIEKFAVIAKGAKACVLDPLDTSRFTLAATLNGGAATYTNGFGTAVRARKATLGGRTVLVAAVGSGGSGKIQVFFLDPLSGQVLDGQPIGTNTAPQPHLTMTINPTQAAGVRRMETGDVNSDGVPDFVIASWNTSMAYAFVSSVSSSGVLSYSDGIRLVPSDASGSYDWYGRSVAVGDLDPGYAGLEVAVVSQGGKKVSPKVFLFHWNGSGFSQYQTIPIMAASVAIGDVTGDSKADLLVATTAGLYVFPGLPAAGNSFVLAAGTDFIDTAVANVDGGAYADAIGTTGTAQVFSGLVSAGQAPSFVLTPIDWIGGLGSAPRLGDINNDGLADLLIGVVTAPANALCPPASDADTVGAAYVFLTNPASPWQPARYVVRPPSLDPVDDQFGWSVEAADGTGIFLVGDNVRSVGGVAGAGQVFVYRVY